MALNTCEEIIRDIGAGRMVVVMDDEDRENEGDLIMAASCVRPEDINFMARYARGLICLTLTKERCAQLRLPLMVSGTDAKHLTNFTVSIDAARGVTTGISAADRAGTIRAAVAPEAGPADLVQPGHIFPLMMQPGGVLARAGHTEAGCDLARLAGLEPAAVIVEILSEDGTMARRGELEEFAARHGLKIGTVADLIRYRMEHEKTVTRVAQCRLATAYGAFDVTAYHDEADRQTHLALVYGEIDPEAPVLVRVHMEDWLSDMLGAEPRDSSCALRTVMQRITAQGRGVIVILRQRQEHGALARMVGDYNLREKGLNLPRPVPGADLRSFGVGAQILVDLGVRRMRVLGSPRRLSGLSGFGLEIEEYVPCG